MSKPKTPSTPDATTVQASEVDAATPALDLAGVAAALIGLAQAVAAVARFPNTPVPPSLVDRIGQAEDALRAAVEDLPGAVALGVPPAAYDDDWIKERFDSLDKALAEKLKTLAVAQTVAEALADRDKAITQLIDQVTALETQGAVLSTRLGELASAVSQSKA